MRWYPFAPRVQRHSIGNEAHVVEQERSKHLAVGSHLQGDPSDDAEIESRSRMLGFSDHERNMWEVGGQEGEEEDS